VNTVASEFLSIEHESSLINLYNRRTELPS